MTDDEILALFDEFRSELRQVKLDVTDIQGAVAELADDYDRRLLRPPKR